MQLLDLKKILRKDRSVQFAYLFGSRGRGRPRPDSDWDIAVYCDPVPSDGPHGKKYSQFYWDLSRGLKTNDLDIVVLNFAPPLLAHKILREGKRLFCRNKSAYVRYFVRLMGEADDARHLSKIHVKALKRAVLNGARHG